MLVSHVFPASYGVEASLAGSESWNQLLAFLLAGFTVIVLVLPSCSCTLHIFLLCYFSGSGK